jgi:hypothetical protein
MYLAWDSQFSKTAKLAVKGKDQDSPLVLVSSERRDGQ